jgi:hypothetical protein
VVTPAAPGTAATAYVAGTSALTTQLSAAVTAPVAGATDFGSSGLGVDATAKTVTVTNRTDGLLTIPTATLTDTTNFKITGGSCTTTTGIANGATCDFTVNFDPQSVSATPMTTTVNIASSSGTGATSIMLQGTGVTALTPNVAADTALGAPNSMETFTISNAAGANNSGQLTVGITGTDAATFSIIGDTCTTMGNLAAAGACTVTVRFLPGAAAAGAKVGTLTVAGAVSGNAATVALTATQP